MNVLISGAMGFMGREVAKLCASQGVEVVAGVDIVSGQADFPLYTDYENVPAADVIIDFSNWKPGADLLDYAVKHRVPAVICATGLSEEQLQRIDEASRVIPVFRSGNMSLGIALVRSLIRRAATVLGEDFDVEIVEMHHNRKVDAPSGTALMLYDAVKDVYDQPREVKGGRCGRDSKRQHNEIGIHAVRGGTITGEHQVGFYGPSERITISHSAENRALFATGALRAAEFLIGKVPGMYSMDDVIGNL